MRDLATKDDLRRAITAATYRVALLLALMVGAVLIGIHALAG